jgi:hypothetical protein
MGDVHGHLMPRPTVRGETTAKTEGGLARMYTKIKEIRHALSTPRQLPGCLGPSPRPSAYRRPGVAIRLPDQRRRSRRVYFQNDGREPP